MHTRKANILGTGIILFLFLIAIPAQACDYSKGVITSISSSSPISKGSVITINGSGFGSPINLGGGNYDRSVYMFYNSPEYPGWGQWGYEGGVRGASVYCFGGGGCTRGMNDIVSWNDGKIEIKIPQEFEQGGIKNAIAAGIDRVSAYVVIGEYNGQKVYIGASEICGTPDNGDNSSFTYTPSCSEDVWQCEGWETCSVDGTQIRSCAKILDCPFADTPSPLTSQTCTYTAPPCTSWIYSDWESCSTNGAQTRTVISALPESCIGGNPVVSQSCTYTAPTCTSWTYSEWSACVISVGQTHGKKTRTIISSSPNDCKGGEPVLTQTCTYPTCTSWTYSDWSVCSANGQQTRTIASSSPESCTGGSPILSQSCTYTPPCTADTWECGDWGTCEGTGLQKRSCFKKNDCPSVSTPSPTTTQACTPAQPKCSADVWTCGAWQTCSAGGIQTRSCSKSFDCPSAETAPPSTVQYCKASQPSDAQQFSDETETVLDQDNIIKATVKLQCPVDSRRATQGSGTVIDSLGTILTNKHVVSGTPGCWVGFVDKYSDEPYFGSGHIADIVKMSSNQDIAVLKLRNPSKQKLTSVNIYQGAGAPKLGHKITTYGYPAKFGSKMTYTSGDFSGVDGSYVKTTAILEYGNSGGGAYLEDGTFLGIPSLVVKGELNSLGYILSISTIKAWLGGSTTLALNQSNNNYSRVSLLDDVDLSDLDSFELYVPGTSPEVPKTTVKPASPSDETDSVQDEQSSSEDSIVLEPETDEESEVMEATERESDELPWWKRFFLWLANLFGRLASAS